MSETSTDRLLAVLHASQSRLTAALDGLTEEQAATQSYDDDWTVAQVASHLGSGAELFTLFLDAGLKGESAPGIEAMQPIWDAWNAQDPLGQTRASVAANDTFLERVEAMTESERETWLLDLFGSERSLPEFLRMRLSEHAVHTWDIVVSFDPTATIPEDASAYVVHNLGPVAGWTGQKHDEQVSVEVRTSGPELAFHLDLGPERGRHRPVVRRHRRVRGAVAPDRGVHPARLRPARPRPHPCVGRRPRRRPRPATPYLPGRLTAPPPLGVPPAHPREPSG